MIPLFLCPWMDGQIFAPSNICTSTIRGGRIAQGAKDVGALISAMDGQIFAPRQLLDFVS